jgi:hypothetical protein
LSSDNANVSATPESLGEALCTMSPFHMSTRCLYILQAAERQIQDGPPWRYRKKIRATLVEDYSVLILKMCFKAAKNLKL